MRHETEIARRHFVTHSSDGIGILKYPDDCFLGYVTENAILNHHVFTILHHFEMDMQSATGFPFCYFGSESHIITLFHRKCADDPFGEHKVIGCQTCRHRKEFDLVLFEDLSIKGEITHFVMTIFDLSANLCYQRHAFHAEIIEFSIGGGFVITLLVCSLEKSRII